MSTFYTLLTKIGAAAWVNAQAANTTVPLTHLAIGDGNGARVVPTESMATLKREVHRVPINSITPDVANPSWLVIEAVIPTEIGGWTVREVGLIGGAQASLMAVGNFPDTYKPLLAEGAGRDLVVRMVIQVANTSVVQLTVDPSVALATNQGIANAIAAHEAKPDPHSQYLTQGRADARYLRELPVATTTAPGIRRLATSAEAAAMSSFTVLVTPATLGSALHTREASRRAVRHFFANF